IVTVCEVSEQAPARLQPELAVAADEAACDLDADAAAVEIEQRPGEPHAIAVDDKANRHAQDIAGRGHLFADIGTAKARVERQCGRSLRANQRDESCRGWNMANSHAASPLAHVAFEVGTSANASGFPDARCKAVASAVEIDRDRLPPLSTPPTRSDFSG